MWFLLHPSSPPLPTTWTQRCLVSQVATSICLRNAGHFFANYLILKSGLPDKHFREDPLNFSILCENKNVVIISEMEVVRIALAALSLWFSQTKAPEESSAGYYTLKGYNQQNLNITADSQMQLNSQLSSVAQSSPTLCDPIDCSTPGLPLSHQLLEFTQTHIL